MRTSKIIISPVESTKKEKQTKKSPVKTETGSCMKCQAATTCLLLQAKTQSRGKERETKVEGKVENRRPNDELT